MEGQGAVQRRLQALQQHLTAASFDTEKAPHLSMNATAAQSNSVWEQIPQVVPRSSYAIVGGTISASLSVYTGPCHMTMKNQPSDQVMRSVSRTLLEVIPIVPASRHAVCCLFIPSADTCSLTMPTGPS